MQSAEGQPTLPELADRLSEVGIEVRPNLASTGRLSGLSFEVEGVRLKGSELGRELTWQALSARYGIGFEPERDRSRFAADGAAAERTMASETADVAERPPARTPQTPLYRAAAALSTRIEVLDQVEALGRAIAGQAEFSRRAQEVLAARQWEQQAATVTPEALSAGLAAAYDSPQAAGARLDALVAGQGAQRAAQVLEQSPEVRGKLRGVDLGGLRSAARREALAATGRLAGELRAATGRGGPARGERADGHCRGSAARDSGGAAAPAGRGARAATVPVRSRKGNGAGGGRARRAAHGAAGAGGAGADALGRALRVARDLVRGMDDRSLGR